MRFAPLVCLAGCLQPDLVPCGDLACPAGFACRDGGCIDRDRLDACADLADGTACTFAGASGLCSDGVCNAEVCGDGVIRAPEQCEPGDVGGATCLTYGFYEPDGLRCGDDCLVDTTGCIGYCGDGLVNGPELCDTTPAGAFTCFDVGFDYGSIACGSVCAPLYDACETIGWKPGAHELDFPSSMYSPRLGELYIPAGGNRYFYATSSASQYVTAPDECGPAAIWADDPAQVFVAAGPKVCRHDGVASWQNWDLPTGIESRLIWGNTPSDVYAAGHGIAHFDGTTWSAVDTGLPPDTEYQRMTGRHDGPIVLTTNDETIAVFRNGAWSLETPLPGGQYVRTAWVAPNGDLHVTSDGKLVSQRAGGAWTTSQPTGGYLTDVWGVGDNAIYAAGSRAGDAMWNFDGTTWTEISGPSNLSYFGGGPAHLVAIEIYDLFHESTGFAWTPMFPVDNEVRALHAFSPSNVIALGVDKLWRYDGTTWNTMAISPVSSRAVWGYDGNKLIVVGDYGATATFDGSKWTPDTVAGNPSLGAVAGEAPDRVFAVDTNTEAIYAFDGTSWTKVFGSMLVTGYSAIWASPARGAYAVGYPSRLVHHEPGTPTNAWIETTLPDFDPVGIWGDDTQLVVTFATRRVWRFANGAWTQLPTRLMAASRKLSGDTNDVFSVSTGQLVRWDGTTWDRVRIPTGLGILGASTAFAGNGVVVVAGEQGVTMLVRPR